MMAAADEIDPTQCRKDYMSKYDLSGDILEDLECTIRFYSEFDSGHVHSPHLETLTHDGFDSLWNDDSDK